MRRIYIKRTNAKNQGNSYLQGDREWGSVETALPFNDKIKANAELLHVRANHWPNREGFQFKMVHIEETRVLN
jgi:hypothetical protein